MLQYVKQINSLSIYEKQPVRYDKAAIFEAAPSLYKFSILLPSSMAASNGKSTGDLLKAMPEHNL